MDAAAGLQVPAPPAAALGRPLRLRGAPDGAAGPRGPPAGLAGGGLPAGPGGATAGQGQGAPGECPPIGHCKHGKGLGWAIGGRTGCKETPPSGARPGATSIRPPSFTPAPQARESWVDQRAMGRGARSSGLAHPHVLRWGTGRLQGKIGSPGAQGLGGVAEAGATRLGLPWGGDCKADPPLLPGGTPVLSSHPPACSPEFKRPKPSRGIQIHPPFFIHLLFASLSSLEFRVSASTFLL